MNSKILMITGSYPNNKCGVGDYTNLLVRELSKKSENNVLTDISAKKTENTINKIKKWNFRNIKKILNEIEKIKPNIIHIQYPTIGYGKNFMINVLPIILRIKGYKVIITIHEYSDNSKLGKIRTGLGAFLSNEVIVVDPRYLEDMKKIKLFKNKKIQYINIASNIPKALEEKRIQIEKNLKVMGYFGFVNETKGIENILVAMKDLKNENRLNVKLLIIAELNSNNEYHLKILRMIEELELSKSIEVTGYLEEKEVASYIKGVDFFVLPFINGFSPKNGSLLAVLQENKKVITTKSTYKYKGFEELILVEQKKNRNELKKEINMLQNMKCEINYKLNRFNWEEVGRKHLKIYKEFFDER